jgi:excisionase family DNA binding protein
MDSAKTQEMMANLTFEKLPAAVGILYHKLELLERMLIEIREIEETERNKPVEMPDEFISRREAAKILKVSLPTLGEWSKAGIIKSYRIATRVRYKRKEVMQALRLVKTGHTGKY